MKRNNLVQFPGLFYTQLEPPGLFPALTDNFHMQLVIFLFQGVNQSTLNMIPQPLRTYLTSS